MPWTTAEEEIMKAVTTALNWAIRWRVSLCHGAGVHSVRRKWAGSLSSRIGKAPLRKGPRSPVNIFPGPHITLHSTLISSIISWLLLGLMEKKKVYRSYKGGYRRGRDIRPGWAGSCRRGEGKGGRREGNQVQQSRGQRYKNERGREPKCLDYKEKSLCGECSPAPGLRF